jgi:transposase
LSPLYRQANQSDLRDAEAVTRSTMRSVPIKSVDQQELQASHRVRKRLMKARTALINEARGLLHA